MTQRLGRLLGHALRDPELARYRARQLAVHGGLRLSGGWNRLRHRVEASLPDRAVAEWRVRDADQGGLMAPGGMVALHAWAAGQPAWCEALVRKAREACAGRLVIFDRAVQFDPAALPWDRDWRADWRFRGAPFPYRPSRDEPAAADIKWPWEVARLAWLQPLLALAAIQPEADWAERATGFLAQFRAANPVGRTAVWAPMEAAMRALTLAIGADLLRRLDTVSDAQLLPWIRSLAEHGEYLVRSLERSAHPNNHLLAELAALHTVGVLLGPVYEPAAAWSGVAARWLWAEMLRQFLPDGVNFEKATGYHRLMVEVCLVAWLAADRDGRCPDQEVRQRLVAACEYAAAMTRADGWIGAFGDNDSARLFAFEPRHTRDPGELLELARVLFGTPTPPGARAAAVVPLLLGGSPPADPGDAVAPRPRLFESGGMIAVQGSAHTLLIDVGEVGLAGQGGHGHNDLLSYELVLDRMSVVVDPGVLTYNGPPGRHTADRGTARHNGLSIDGEELAPLLGRWTIGADAVPDAPSLEAGPQVRARGGHAGYARLPGAVHHRRTWSFDPIAGRLEVTDELAGHGEHEIVRHLHLAPGTECRPGPRQVELTASGRVWLLWWEGQADLELTEEGVAASYGSEAFGTVLRLRNRLQVPATLHYGLRPAGLS